MATATKHEPNTVAEDNISRNMFVMDAFISNITGNKRNLSHAKNFLIENGILPSDLTSNFTLTSDDYVRALDKIGYGGLRSDLSDYFKASNGDVNELRNRCELAVNKITGDANKVYDDLAAKGVQPLIDADARFNLLFKSVPSHRLYVNVADSKPLTKTPFIAGVHTSDELDTLDTSTVQGHQRALIIGRDAIHASSIEKDKLKDNMLLVSTYYNSSEEMAAKQGISVEQVNQARNTSEMSPDVLKQKGLAHLALLKENAAKNNNNQQSNSRSTSRRQNVPKGLSPAKTIEFASDYTKSGISKDANAQEQVKQFLGTFFSKADMAYLNKTLVQADYQYSPDVMNRARSILEHLYDKGIEYDISKSEQYPNQVTLRLGDSNGTRIRLLDENENAKLIGRVHTSMGSVFFPSHDKVDEKTGEKKMDTWVPEDTNALIDYFTGSNTAVGSRPRMPKGGTTVRLSVPGVSRPANYKPLAERINAISYNTNDEAYAQLIDYIDTARDLYRKQLLDDVSDGLNPDLDEEREAMRAELAVYEKEQAHKLSINPEMIDSEEMAEQIRNDIIDSYVDDVVGTYKYGFNPSKVQALNSQVRSFNITEAMVTAMKHVNYDTDKLKGNDFANMTIKNRMVKFDPNTAVSIDEQTNPFLKEMQLHVQNELKELGLVGYDLELSEDGEYVASVNTKKLPEVSIDENGIMNWQAYRQRGWTAKGKDGTPSKPIWKDVSSTIGQVFAPDEKGIVVTNFASGENHGFIPGYRGYFEYSGVGEKDRMERLRLVGYEQTVRSRLSSTLREQVMRFENPVTESIRLGMDDVAVNKIYHGDVYGERVALDWYEKNELPDDIKDKIIETNSNRVRFGNKYSDNATTFAETGVGGKSLDENAFFATADNKNMRVLHEDYKGTFDTVMTGTNKNQGMVVYLAEGTTVNPDGTVNKAPETFDEKGNLVEPKAPLRNTKYFENSSQSAWDRQQMAANQLMKAYHVDEKARTALMTFGGWTFDDSYVVSKEFADRNKVPDAETGEPRPLKAGDKISDFGGNKGTIGLVVDRNMEPEKAKELGLEREVGIFKMNSDLDVVGSPYSMLSRHNAGVILEMQGEKDENGNFANVKPVLDEHGNPMPGCESGELNVIVTDMLTDKKSHAYSEEDLAEGKGRKVSSQLVWVLNEMGADNIVKEAFGRNDSAWATYRDYLIAVGYDMENDGTLRVGYKPHGDEVRHAFDVDESKTPEEFMQTVMNNGGMLNLPFDVRLASGAMTDKLPILAASSRSNTELLDGEMKVHSYTKDYVEIYGHAQMYMKAVDHETALKEADVPTDAKEKEKFLASRRDASKAVNDLKEQAQLAVNRIQDGIVTDRLGGYNGESSKHSYLRENIMSKRASNSATGVATVNPNLDIDTIAVSPEIYKVLDLKDPDELVGIWRDPALRDGAFRAMKVVVDENISGLSMNPVVDKSFDGDFDGDTYGIKKFHTKAAQQDLKNIAAMQHNLLDKGTEVETSYLNISMDMVSGAAKAGVVAPYKKEIVEEFDANGTKVEKDIGSGKPKKDLVAKLSDIAVNESPEDALRLTNAIVKASVRNNFGAAHVSLRSEEAMMESMYAMANDGAKGSIKAADGFGEYYKNQKTAEDERRIQKASGIKSDLTGVAGSFSQRLMAVMRDTDPKIALETTYVITQGTLQIKHDAEKGEKLAVILNHDLSNLLDGRPRNHRPEFGKPKPLSVNDFKKEMRNIYNDELDVPLREDYLDALATALSKDGKGHIIEGMNKRKDVIASPLDQIAYNGGLQAIDKLARNNRSLGEGRYSGMMMPEKMKNATKETVIAKADTQDIEAREKARQARLANAPKVTSFGGKDPFAQTEEYQPAQPKPEQSQEKPKARMKDDDGLSL